MKLKKMGVVEQPPKTYVGIIDSGADEHAAGLQVYRSLQEVQKMAPGSMQAVSAFGEERDVLCVGDLNAYVRGVHIIEGAETLYSVKRFAEDGMWTIIPPRGMYEFGVYVVSHKERRVVMRGDDNFIVDPTISVPRDLPKVELPLLPAEDGLTLK